MRTGACAILLSAAVMLPTRSAAGMSRSSCSAFVAPAAATGGLRPVPRSLAQLRGSGLACATAPSSARRMMPLCMQAEPGTAPLVKAIAGTTTLKATDYYKPLVEGDILESDDRQRKIVLGSYVALATLFVKGCVLLPDMDAIVACKTVLAVLVLFLIFLAQRITWFKVYIAATSFDKSVYLFIVGYEFADLGSGVYHWSMDNYGTKNTPVFGTQIEAFQGHHELPWTITYRQVCNNIYKICQATFPVAMAGIVAIDDPYVLLWMSTAISFINLSQELHKWTHQGRDQTAWWINTLQDYNVIVTRKGHLAHHKPPFESNYCIVSGHCNSLADRIGLFRGLEKAVFTLTGNVARCENNERLLEDRVVELGIKRKSVTLSRNESTEK